MADYSQRIIAIKEKQAKITKEKHEEWRKKALEELEKKIKNRKEVTDNFVDYFMNLIEAKLEEGRIVNYIEIWQYKTLREEIREELKKNSDGIVLVKYAPEDLIKKFKIIIFYTNDIARKDENEVFPSRFMVEDIKELFEILGSSSCYIAKPEDFKEIGGKPKLCTALLDGFLKVKYYYDPKMEPPSFLKIQLNYKE